jgi:curved DNA-binding protein CbpA
MSYRHQSSQSTQSVVVQPTSYDVLGVSPAATDADIKLAYRLLVLQWHPDRKIHDHDLAEQNLKIINEAYSRIKTRSARDHYNQILRLQQKAMALSQATPRATTAWGKFWNWLTKLETKVERIRK